jgi:hypothetical protein
LYLVNQSRLNVFKIQEMKKLRQHQLKSLKGGLLKPCGVKVTLAGGGTQWFQSNDDNGNGQTRDEASSVQPGVAVYDNGNLIGWTTGNWCCDSCSWNQS